MSGYDYEVGDIVYLSPDGEDKAEYIGFWGNGHFFTRIEGDFYNSLPDDECKKIGVPVGAIPFSGKPYDFGN